MFERVRRTRSGGFVVRLSRAERDLLRTLPGQLRELITDGDAARDPALRRLYPAAYQDDLERSAEFDRLVRDDLTEQRLAAIDIMERTIDAPRLTQDEAVGWLAALNDLRLVLGTRLEVSEETTPADFPGDTPEAQTFALYAFLSYLEEELVAALTGG